MVPVITGIASLIGIGIGVNEMNKRKGKNDSSVSSKITDVVSNSVHDASGQADAVVVDTVNAIRIDHLLKRLAAIDRNKAGADNEIRQLKAEVQKLLTTNRGGVKGIHGFLGETSQVHISNIKAFINGEEPLYILLDDNSMTDYTRGMEII